MLHLEPFDITPHTATRDTEKALIELLKSGEWYTAGELAHEFLEISRKDLKKELTALRRKKKIMAVEGPGSCGLIWHAYDQRLNEVVEIDVRGLASERIGGFFPYPLPEDLKETLQCKINDYQNKLPGVYFQPSHKRRATTEAKRYLSDLDLTSKKARPQEGFPFRCQWRAHSLGIEHGKYKLSVIFQERISLPNLPDIFSVVEKEGVTIKRSGSDNHLDISMLVSTMWIEASAVRLLSPPSHQEIIAATKRRLLACRSLRKLVPCFMEIPEVKLLSET